MTLEGFKALESLGKGEATKIIIPSDLQGIASAVKLLKSLKIQKNNKNNKAYLNK